MEREIELLGALDETERQRLLEIAERCPVHKTLNSEVDIVSFLHGQSGQPPEKES
jgi:putative redox protein